MQPSTRTDSTDMESSVDQLESIDTAMNQLVEQEDHSPEQAIREASRSRAARQARQPRKRTNRTPATESNKNGLESFLPFIEAPFVYRKRFLATLIGFGLLAWVLILVWPRTYASEAKLQLRVGRESVALDPTATTSQTLTLQKTHEEEIRSATEVVKSRYLAELVAEEIGPENIVNGSLPSEGPNTDSWMKKTTTWFVDRARDGLDVCLTTSGIRDSLSPKEEAIMMLQKAIKVTSERKTNIIALEARSKSPQMAQLIADTLANKFIEQHMTSSRTAGSFEFFTEQAKAAKEKVSNAILKKGTFLQENKIVSVEANRDILKSQLADVEKDLLVANGELEQARAEIADLTKRAALEKPEKDGGKVRQADSTWNGIRQRINELEVLELEYKSKYSADKPILRQTQEKLKGAREILAKLEKDRVNESTIPNPVKLRIEAELQQLETKVIGLRSLVTEKQKQKDNIQKAISGLVDIESKLTVMDREIARLETNVRDLNARRDEAGVIEALQAEKISNVRKVQPASFVERAVTPDKKLLAAGLGFFGICSAFGLVFLKARGNQVLRYNSSIASDLSVEVVASIPKLTPPRNFLEIAQQDRYHSLVEQCESILVDVISGRLGNVGAGATKTIGVVGCEPGSGASMVSAALAISAAKNCQLRTLLIDANLDQQSIASGFDETGASGLSDFLAENGEIEDYIVPTQIDRLEIVGRRSSVSDRLELSQDDVAETLQRLYFLKDIVIVDLPPANSLDQGSIVAPHLDHLIVVLESDQVDSAKAQLAMRRIKNRNRNVFGIVHNKVVEKLPKWIRNQIQG